MIDQHLKDRLMRELDTLPAEKQQSVLEYAQALSRAASKDVPGKNVLQFAGSIDAEDLAIMQQAIEEGCEQVDREG